MTFWDFVQAHPFLTLFYMLVAIYGIEVFIKAFRGVKNKRRK